MTTRPYELLARFAADGTVAGVSVRTITTVDGRDYEGSPQPLSGTDDPAFVEFAQTFAASIVAQRDQLLADKQTVDAQIATLTSERDAAQGRVAELQSQLDALLNPPPNSRHLAPYVFLSLLKPEEIYALQTSTDPVVVVGRAKLQTIITYVDLDHSDTIGLANYMESAGLIAAGRAAQILAGAPPA